MRIINRREPELDQDIARIKNPRLFKTAPHPLGKGGNVVLNWRNNSIGEMALIAEQYLRAARMLVEVHAAKRGYSDLEAYPIVFNYRHALELAIKAILIVGNRLGHLLEEDDLLTPLAEIFGTHGLSSHLPRLRRILRAAEMDFDFKDTEAAIREFDRFDPNSFVFRYPVNKRGKATTPKHFVFSPTEFAKVADPIIETLVYGCSGLEEYATQFTENFG